MNRDGSAQISQDMSMAQQKEVQVIKALMSA
jgi:hypothetical protein